MKSKNIVFHAAYGIMLVLFICAIISITVQEASKSLAQAEYDRTEPFVSGWHMADGAELDEKSLRKISGIAGTEETSVYNTLPESAANADVLFFRAKNMFYSVYINGELVQEPQFGESPFYTNSTGVRYISVPLSPEYVGKEIEIRFTAAYPSSRCGFDGFRIGSSGGAILSIIKEKLVAFIVCVLILFVGLFLSLADIPINMLNRKNHELLFLGLFSICVAAWCLSELNVIQFFFDDSRLLHIISCGALMLMPMPLVLYLDKAVGFKTRFIVPVVCTLSMLEFIICWGLHLLKIKDIHDTITASHILIGISAILMIYSSIRNMRRNKDKSTKIYRVLRGVGMGSIGVAAVIDLPRYYMGLTNDSAQFVRVGLLIFTICYGIASLESTINAVRKGAQTEFISKLAYEDGLTGVGNRTLFEERLDELEKIKATAAPIGLIMFDVNDLKFVNDNLGHPLGDSMIKTAADMISSSFEPAGGECFRIGGDEFAVIISGSGVAVKYDKQINEFADRMEHHNSDPNSRFRISIAHGVFFYNSSCGVDTIKEALKKADEQMYETKREMKAHQSPPQEYYANRIAVKN